MHTYIALLKGINVGGHKKVPMAELRQLLAASGFRHVQTYIQSGNVVLQSSGNAADVRAKIQQAIATHFGFEVAVIVTTHSELQTIFEAFPFSKEIKEKSYFILLDKVPDAELVAAAEQITFEDEDFRILNNCLYFYSLAGYGKSKFNLSVFERKLKVTATARNYNTMVKLLSLSAEN